MAELLPVLKPRYFDDNGGPLAGGKLYSYLAGTSTPVATYTDQSGATPNTNPVVLDGNGYASVWIGAGSYKFVLTDANDVTKFTVDNVTANNAEAPSLWATHAITDGQAATYLAGETIDFTLYSSGFYDVEITRGTTVIANGPMAVQNINGIGRALLGFMITDPDVPHGVDFSMEQVGVTTVWKLKAAADVGAGNGRIKLTRRLVPAA